MVLLACGGVVALSSVFALIVALTPPRLPEGAQWWKQAVALTPERPKASTGLDWSPLARELSRHPRRVRIVQEILQDLKPDELPVYAEFLGALAGIDPDPGYLQAACAVGWDANRDACWPQTMFLSHYRLEHSAEPLLAIAGDATRPRDARLLAIRTIGTRWEESPVPDQAAEVRRVLLAILDSDAEPDMRLNALLAARLTGTLGCAECGRRRAAILADDPGLADDQRTLQLKELCR